MVAAQATRLRVGLGTDPRLLANAFSRPLYERVPALVRLPEVMRRAGAPVVALSGSGLAHYTAVGDPALAQRVADRLRNDLGNAARVVVVTPIPERSMHPGDYDVS